MKDVERVRRDFDAIAGAIARQPARDRLTRAERTLLRHLPAGAASALEVGCGAGGVARAMAARGLRVTAIDLSPEMIGLARRRTPAALGVTYRAADFMDDARPLGRHDVVVAVNALHHLPLDRAVARMRALVAPGGAVLIQDVLSRPGLRYLLWNLAGGVERLVGRLARARALDAEVAALYEEHGRGETYLTPDEARAAYAARLPGARVLHHAGWRYSVVWRAPG